MTLFIANATALANHFKACVIAIHHTGLSDDKRTRGHTSLLGGVDAQILTERKVGEMTTTLTLQKIKDEASNIRLEARLERVVVGHDEDGEEVFTLIVAEVVNADAPATKSAPAKTIPASLRLLLSVLKNALLDTGIHFRPFANGPEVHAVAERHVRVSYFKSIAEKARADEDASTLYDRQDKSFRRAAKSALGGQTLVAAEHERERFFWLPGSTL